jgi:hypothetical protein
MSLQRKQGVVLDRLVRNLLVVMDRVVTVLRCSNASVVSIRKCNFSHPRDFKEAFRWYHELAWLDGNNTAQNMVGL